MAGIASAGTQPLKPGQTYDAAGRVINSPLAPSVLGDPGTFGANVTKQGSDYDTIMAGYRNLTSPEATAPSANINDSVSNLGNLATTGGYSDQDKADLRARGVSPIRSIYSQAEENLSRQKALQGGYSPGYTSALTRMARDESTAVSGQVSNVNAGIAENVTRNRLSAASPYASAASEQMFRPLDFRMNALGGARSLYGTTPALAATFGNQVGEAARLGQGQQDLNIRRLNAQSQFLRN